VTRSSAVYTPTERVFGVQLPLVQQLKEWSGEKFTNTLRYIPNHPDDNLNFRQLMHIAYKLAAKHGVEHTGALTKNSKIIGEQVTSNIYERYIKRSI